MLFVFYNLNFHCAGCYEYAPLGFALASSTNAPLLNLRPIQQVISLEDVRMDASTETLYIVMELMECDLERVLASGQILTQKHVKVLLKQLLLGVQAMHLRGIIRKCFCFGWRGLA